MEKVIKDSDCCCCFICCGTPEEDLNSDDIISKLCERDVFGGDGDCVSRGDVQLGGVSDSSEQYNGTKANLGWELKNTMFLIRILLEIPKDTIQDKYLVNDNVGVAADWLKLCQRCKTAIVEAHIIYEQLLKLRKRFTDVQKDIVQILKRSKECNKGVPKGDKYMQTEEKGPSDVGVYSSCFLHSARKCRQHVIDHDYVEWTKSVIAQDLEAVLSPAECFIKNEFPQLEKDDGDDEETYLVFDKFSPMYADNYSEDHAEDSYSNCSRSESDTGNHGNHDDLGKGSQCININQPPCMVEKKDHIQDASKGHMKKGKSRVRNVSGAVPVRQIPARKVKIKTTSVLKSVKIMLPSKQRVVSKRQKAASLSQPLVNGSRVKQTKGRKKKIRCSEKGCSETFFNQDTLDMHLAKHATEPLFKCQHCGQSFQHYEDKKRHNKISCRQGVEKEHTRECPICHNWYTNVLTLRKHIVRSHPEQKVRIEPNQLLCPWEGCGKTFSKKIILRNHISRHKKEPAYKCRVCDEAFYDSNRRTYHEQAKHEVGGTKVCEFCNHKCTTQAALNQHRQIRHNVQPKQYILGNKTTVPSCTTTTTDVGESENTKLPFECPHCYKRFSKKAVMQTHVKGVHEKKLSFQCTMCDAKFVYQHQLKKHQMTVHNVGGDISELPGYGPPTCRCPVKGCRQRFFGKKSDLEKHMKENHGEDGTKLPFVCSICGKSFGFEFRLRYHEQGHLNKDTKPYQCDTCGKRFSVSIYLRVHELNVHKAPLKVNRRIKCKAVRGNKETEKQRRSGESTEN